MTKKELTKLKIKAVISIIVYCFWYVVSVVQATQMFTAIFFTGEHIFIKVVIFVLTALCFAFSIYDRDKAVKLYHDAKSQSEI